MGGMPGSLPGSNEPYGNLLNCTHATDKYFPSTYHGQDAKDTAVNKTLPLVIHMLERKAEIQQS